MKDSTLFTILEDAYIADWKEKFKTEAGGNLFNAIQRKELELSKNLTDIQKEDLKRYGRSWENFYEFMIYKLSIEILHIGIKIGIEIENSYYID